MKPGDLVAILPHKPRMPLDGLGARIVAVHATHIMATVGQDPRPMRFDHGTYLTYDAPSHHAGAE